LQDSTSEIFLMAPTITLAEPCAVWRLLRTDTYAPLVVVQIVGGIVLGPSVLGPSVLGPSVLGGVSG
jgi:hypothetical protein